MSKRSREKRATPRGAYEPADNESLERAFAQLAGEHEPADAPAYPFDPEDEENG
jgi:hypothetical protein